MTSTLIGYARCSTRGQNLEDQIRRLTDAGCARIFQDWGVSGKLASRPEWDKCRDHMREGDTLVVTKLDRVGRSIKNLIDIAQDLREKGIALKVLDQGIDTGTIAGQFFFHVMAGLAEFERGLIKERTEEGLRTARINGVKFGRTPILTDKQQVEVRKWLRRGAPVNDIATMVKVDRGVIYRVKEKMAKEDES